MSLVLECHLSLNVPCPWMYHAIECHLFSNVTCPWMSLVLECHLSSNVPCPWMSLALERHLSSNVTSLRMSKMQYIFTCALLHYLLVNLRNKYSNIYLTHSHHQVSNLGPSAVKTALLRIEWPGEDEFGHSYLRLDDMPIASRPDISCELLNNTVSQPTDYIFICIFFPAIFCSKINPRSATYSSQENWN